MYNFFSKNRKLKVLALAVLCSVFAFLNADVKMLEMKRVCDLHYNGDPSDLNDSTIRVPEEVVAVSAEVKVDMPTDTSVYIGGTPSILFIIDHSGSMCYDYGGNDPDNPQDQWGQRFVVTYDLIDTLRRMYPASEIGIVVFRQHMFFDPVDDPLFVQHPQYPTGAYIPFFKLDSSYASAGGRTGAQILQGFMETDTLLGDNTPWGYTSPGYRYLSLKYWPTNYASNLVATNINVGFDVAKLVFQDALYPPERQFIIFFSDGLATESNGPHGAFDEDYYVNGDSVPTTFTIFFTKQGVVPPDIQTMTTNIQNNGYSTTNPKSNAWDVNIGQEDLKQFIIDTIMTIISTEVIGSPITITVNGTTVSNYDTVNNQFTFDSHFPLTGWQTDFDFKIAYTIVKDSILPNGDTIPVMSDSTNEGSFSVVVDPTVTVPPDWYPSEFELICWEREIVFFYNSAQIFEVTEIMDPVELRFNFIPGDKGYDYTKVAIELTNKTGTGLDKETYTLSKNGTTFSGTFPRAVIPNNASPTVGDGVLQHYSVDTIVATFRNDENPRLPLDTLQEEIPCRLSGSINVVSAEYWDLDADGYVDSIYVAATTDLSGGLTDAHVAEIVDSALSLPAFRGFTVNGSGVSSGGFHINVSEDKAHDPVTYVTSDDVLTVTQDILSIGGWVEGVIVPIIDKVAPIIHWESKSAYLTDYLIDSIADTLGVKFSEPVKNVTHAEPFYFLRPDGNLIYQATLNSVSQPQPDSIVFEVSDVTGVTYMEGGDSLWIHETDRVCDVLDNYQNNYNNIKRELYVERILIPYELIPNAITPFNLSDINNNNFIIPDNIIDILNNQGILDDLNISQNNNGDYIGMLIVVVPDNTEFLLEDFKLEGHIMIFDAVGNAVRQKSRMGWDEEYKGLVWIWNVKNEKGRTVGSAMYLCIIEIEEVTKSLGYENGGPKQVKRIFVGVKE